MTDLRDMQLLAALARQKHFAHAADECGISQPAFSSRIRNLEQALGTPIVVRGNRFLGFTPEGEIVLKWAHKLLADADGLRQEIEAAKGALSGRVRIGAVPTALSFVADLPAKLRDVHPELTVHILSTSSARIRRGMDEFTLDAGITYLDEAHAPGVVTYRLYEERYVLIAPRDMAPRPEGEATWMEASQLPLCLLSPEMRNRRIIDETFEVLGVAPVPVVETNAFTAALAQVATGAAATIAPEKLAASIPIGAGAVHLDLVEPALAKPVGLVVADRNPVPPTVLALKLALGVR